ncbi:hypothetical protein EVAR_91013_1 [Eumeta japonica]|uniref:Uncharacterized protein n=1 Tax=Eumeta variegata TaxID=151549 RepID=A0A4C1SML2_EUMVA|nr:hypothetical protein EVAR_91013_1 [Eumeta japonica]
MGPPDGGRPNPTRKITDWKRVSTALEKIDTPPLNSIPDNIRTTDEIDSAIGALTNHIRTVVEKCEREVPASSDRRKFPPDILELIRAKNKALPRERISHPEYRSRARALQREVKARVQEFRNECWSDLMEEIRPSHKAFWSVTKALKTEGIHLFPAQKTSTVLLLLDDGSRIEEEVLQNLLEPKDDLTPVSLSEVQLLVRSLKTRKAPGLDGVSNKAIKCFPQQLLSLLVAILTRAFKIVISSRLERGGGNRHERTHSTRRLIRAGVPKARPLPAVSAYTNDIPRPTSGVQLALSQTTPRFITRVGIEPPSYHPPPPESHELDQWFRLWR